MDQSQVIFETIAEPSRLPARVSVIVPFHNAAATIVETARSLIGQSAARQIEVVWVNDGSTDNGSALLQRELRKIDAGHFAACRIVRHAFRRGVAEATSTGLRHATGDYVVRCDADDTFSSDGLAGLISRADADDADVVWCGYVENRDGHERAVFPRRNARSLLDDTPINTVQYSLCNKLLRRSMIEQHNLYPFEGVDCWEDLGMVARMLALTDKIVYTDTTPYRYRIDSTATSLSRSHRDTILRDHLRCAVLLEEWFVTKGLAARHEQFLTRLKFIAKVKYMRGDGKDVGRWKSTFPEVNSRILGIRHVAFIYRLAFAMVAVLPTRFTQWVCDIFSARNRGQAQTRR